MAENLGDHAQLPKKAVVDGTTTEMRSAQEMIDLENHEANKTAIAKSGGWGAIVRRRAKPPNAMGRQ